MTWQSRVHGEGRFIPSYFWSYVGRGGSLKTWPCVPFGRADVRTDGRTSDTSYVRTLRNGKKHQDVTTTHLSVTKTRPSRSACWGRSFKPFISRISHDLTCPRILPFMLISYILIVLVVYWNKNLVSFCYNGLDSTSFSTLVLKDRPPSWQKKSAKALRPFSFLHCRKTRYWWGHAFTHSFIQVKCSSGRSLKMSQLCQSRTEIDCALWAEFCLAKV